MRNGFLWVLILTFIGCAHNSQYEPTHCRWGNEDPSAADRSAAEAWRVQEERLLSSGNIPPSN